VSLSVMDSITLNPLSSGGCPFLFLEATVGT